MTLPKAITDTQESLNKPYTMTMNRGDTLTMLTIFRAGCQHMMDLPTEEIPAFLDMEGKDLDLDGFMFKLVGIIMAAGNAGKEIDALVEADVGEATLKEAEALTTLFEEPDGPLN